MHREFLPAGTLSIGANYWASHAGPFMWRDWDPIVVQRDLDLLVGLDSLRVFPLWPDFQPIHCLRRDNGIPVEFRHGEKPLSNRSGVSEQMLDRFEWLADQAYRRELGLIVGLITGWMSGRLFVPPALDGLNPITDASSIIWQTRFIHAFVERFRRHPAIRAWDLGNECNCMGQATREQAWVWTATMANTIRQADPSRPIISGMHSLSVDPRQPWSIQDQAELTDYLTTHPYPLFTPHCNRESLSTIRPLLHATAETALYGDLSGKPAFVEEVGNFGPAFCDEQVGADIARANLFSLWAHDGRAALWWCAYDQTHLERAPHDWIPMERQLGLVRDDGGFKPVLIEMQKTRDAVRSIGRLAPRQRDAVCILTAGQDQWGAAYTAFILAKQAGFDLQFHYGDVPLPDAQLYLLPSVRGLSPLSRRMEMALKARVEAGATLYVSIDDAILNEISSMSGLRVLTRFQRAEECRFQFLNTKYTLSASTQFEFALESAETLAIDQHDQPVFAVSPCGQGKVYSLTVPIETELARKSGAFDPKHELPFWKIYRQIGGDCLANRCLHKNAPALGITEHASPDGERITVLINYSRSTLDDVITLKENCSLAEHMIGEEPLLDGQSLKLSLPPGGAAVWKIERRS